MFQHPSPARGFPCSPTPLIAALGAPTSATPLALGTRPHFLGSALVQGMLPMGSDLPWLSRARVRCRGMTHVSSLPIADLAPVVRSREHPVPEREAAAQAGVSHGGSLADLRPGNPGGNPWGAAGRAGGCQQHGMLVRPTPTCSEAPDVGTSPILTLHSTSWNKQENPQLLVRC